MNRAELPQRASLTGWPESNSRLSRQVVGAAGSRGADVLDEAKAQFLTSWQKVPHRLDSARALFYLSRPCQVCVRVSYRRGLLRRASPQERGSHPLGDDEREAVGQVIARPAFVTSNERYCARQNRAHRW
jgi:hypothetical protein